MMFHHVQLLTSNLTEQLEFYQDVLGLSVLEQSPNAVTFQVGFSKLEFIQDERDVFYHFAFNVPSHQFTEAEAWLGERTPIIQDTSTQYKFHSQNWNADMVYFYDAGGNVVELIARHDLQSEVSEHFSVRSLECVSELGIVTDDVPQTIERIQKLVAVPFYRATMDEQFVPVGDERGLFIVVKKERIWFPETKPAVVAPFKVILSNQQDEVVTLDQNSLQLANIR
jgi:catechol 2,3-dioxygenase-like lactoylglutathione lyase family enzyme